MRTESAPKNRQHTWLKILSFGLNVAIAVVCWLNIQPYVGAVEYLMAETGANSAVVQWLSALPIIGAVMAFFSALFGFVVGTLIWAVFQILELLPQFVKGDRQALERVSQNLAKFPAVGIEPKDQEWVRVAKSRYNATPARWHGIAVLIACAAYLIDFIFCGLYYPPIEGGWSNFGLFLVAPSLSDIDWLNLALLVITLFAVEVAVWLARFVRKTYDII